MALRDPETGKKPIRAVYPVADKVRSELFEIAPDLQIAFAPGYRSSWDSSLGGAPLGQFVVDNPKPWNGDHAASDISETPGFIATNFKIKKTDPVIIDLSSSIVSHFGLKPIGNGDVIW